MEGDRNADAHLRLVVEHSPDLILTLDREGKIRFINRPPPPFTVEGVLGTSAFDYIRREDRARYQKAFGRRPSDGRAPGSGDRFRRLRLLARAVRSREGGRRRESTASWSSRPTSPRERARSRPSGRVRTASGPSPTRRRRRFSSSRARASSLRTAPPRSSPDTASRRSRA